MNMQDIADFISLVKDPVKFEKALKDLQDEQDRLKAVIATVGKASELDSLRKKLEKDVAKKLVELDEKIIDVDVKAKQANEQVKTLQQSLQVEISKATRLQQEAIAKEISAKDLAASFSGRDKALRQQEIQATELRSTLANSIAEYEEKLTKLRSVMN